MTSAAGLDEFEIPLHERTMVFRAYERRDSLRVVGRLTDVRPWAPGVDVPVPDGSDAVGVRVRTVHDLELAVSVTMDDFTISEATATMHTFPHTECPSIEAAFAGLVGLTVMRGYTRRVQEMFGGPRGCTHLEQLARSLGPVVIQAVTSARARAVSRGELPDLLTSGGNGSPWARDSCHIWAEGSVADQKLEAGWRPGTGSYPSPPLRYFLDLKRRS